MKNLIYVIALLSFVASVNAQARTLEAKPLADLITAVKTAKFKYKETDLVFGYDQIQSCLFVSDQIVVLKNYCYPEKTYPAKSFTIISAKFGMIDLYQEQLSNVLQRDVLITAFPETIGVYLPPSLLTVDIPFLNKVIGDLYYKYPPACWSTNYSAYSNQAEAKCTVNVSEVDGFAAWASETQSLTADKAKWSQLINQLETLFKN